MFKKYQRIIVGAATLAAIIPLLQYGLRNNKMFEALSAVLILVTVYYLWRYTQATQEMKEEMTRQNEMALRPMLNLYLREIGSTADRFVIRNVGHVPAYNIDVEPIHVDGQVYVFHFSGENFILEGDGDERPLQIFSTTEQGNVSVETETFRSHFTSPASVSPETLSKSFSLFAIFLIRYKSLLGKKYYSLFKYYTRHPLTNEVMIEFVASGEGHLPMSVAWEKAEQKERRQSLYTSLWRKKAK